MELLACRRAGRLRALAATVTLALGALVAAPAVAQEEASAERPERGLRMADVEARYGAPATRHQAVGQPPITRWDYPGFVVFFEHEYVVHAVVLNR